MAKTNLVNEKDAVVADFEVLVKVLKKTLIASGYGVGDTFLETSKGFAGAWIVEMRFEVERRSSH